MPNLDGKEIYPFIFSLTHCSQGLRNNSEIQAQRAASTNELTYMTSEPAVLPKNSVSAGDLRGGHWGWVEASSQNSNLKDECSLCCDTKHWRKKHAGWKKVGSKVGHVYSKRGPIKRESGLSGLDLYTNERWGLISCRTSWMRLYRRDSHTHTNSHLKACT